MTREVARIGAAKDIKTIDVIHTPIFLREVRDEFHQKMVVRVRGQQIARSARIGPKQQRILMKHNYNNLRIIRKSRKRKVKKPTQI